MIRPAAKVLNRCTSRFYHELSYCSHGDPEDVLSFRSDPSILDNDAPSTIVEESLVKVEMHYAPWNPADINMVEGKYPSPYTSQRQMQLLKSRYFSCDMVPGSEGIGRITSSNFENLSDGSLVIVGDPGLGTLRSSLWVPKSSLLRIPEALVLKAGPSACTLGQLGGTALRMLSDFVSLEPGSVVLQNAGNSGVGFMVSQLASTLFDASVVSVVRRGTKSREDYDRLLNFLKTEGKNDLVVAEEDLEDKETMKRFLEKLREFSGNGELPRLALNAVGGESAKKLLRLLDDGGTLVTYGGMSEQPVITATPRLIFKDVRVFGYWHSRWMVQQSKDTKQAMIDVLSRAVIDEQVSCPPVNVFPLHCVHEALHWQSSQRAPRSKLVFDCRQN